MEHQGSKSPKSPSAGHSVAEIPNRTMIAERLNKALRAAKPVNRSSDLVPLNQVYDTMRRDLKALIATAKTYKDAIIQLDKARLDVSRYEECRHCL